VAVPIPNPLPEGSSLQDRQKGLITMATPKKSIALSPDEDRLLRIYHRQSGIPDGQFLKRPKFFKQFIDGWNQATERNDTPEEIHHYIQTRRKRPKGRPGRWEPLGDECKKLRSQSVELLSSAEWDLVDQFYAEYDVSADRLLFEKSIREEFTNLVNSMTGKQIPDIILVTAVISRRKAGLLPKINHKSPNSGISGFTDMDEVG